MSSPCRVTTWAPQLFCQIDVRAQGAALRRRKLLAARRLHDQRREGAPVRLGHVRRRANGLHVARILRHIHQHVFARLNPLARPRGFSLAGEALGHAAQGDLAQGCQVLLREEIGKGRLGAGGQVDLARLEALYEVVRLDVHQFHGRRLVEHAVGNAFVHHDVRDGGYLVVQAFEMLDVHRGEHVYARTEQLLHVLVALTVATSGSIRVGELVDEHYLGMTLQHGVEIELLEQYAAMAHFERRNLLEPVHQRHGVGTRMGLHVTHHDVETLCQHLVGLFQHGVRLAHAGGIAEEDLEFSSRVALCRLGLDDLPENGVGIPFCFVVHDSTHCRFDAATMIARQGDLHANSPALLPGRRRGGVQEEGRGQRPRSLAGGFRFRPCQGLCRSRAAAASRTTAAATASRAAAAAAARRRGPIPQAGCRQASGSP